MVVSTSFRDELRAAVDERHCADHPMTEKWARGELGRDALMGWGVEHYYWISNIRPPPFLTLAYAPQDVRDAILETYREEHAPARPPLPSVRLVVAANGANVDEVRKGRVLPTTEAWVAWRI